MAIHENYVVTAKKYIDARDVADIKLTKGKFKNYLLLASILK